MISGVSLLSAGALLFGGCTGSSPKGEKENQPHNQPNVLLLMVDDLTTDLGCYGNPTVRTPHIDSLAARGITFTKAYCQAALSNPSRASLLTGLRPDSTKVYRLKRHFRQTVPEVTTLPQLFMQNGYFSARVGKVFHMGVPDAMARCSSGGDDSLSWHKAINCYGYELNSNGYFYNATPWETDSAGMGGAISWLRAEKGDDQQHDYNAATETIKLLEENAEKPFFIAAGFIRPHVPLVAPKRYFEMYDTCQINVPENPANDRNDLPTAETRMFGANFNITPDERREAIRAYYACISFVDDQVGRIMAKIDELGLRENTVVVLVSDHGFQLGEHGFWFKNFLFNESANAPLIVSSPFHKPTQGQQCHQLVEFVDIYQSVAELCHLEVKEQKQGLSFVPLLENPNQPWKTAAFVQTRYNDSTGGNSIRTQNWCYNEWDEGENRIELYDLNTDSQEFFNLANNPAYHDTVQMLSEKLHAGWQEALPK